jgi:MerR family copper efflux transcriptional regulator
MPGRLTVARLAKLSGVAPDTVRFYERRGLLPAPPRSPAGYRNYAERDLERLRFIRGSKELGLTLEQIADLLKIVGAEGAREQVQDLAVRRLRELEIKVAQLSAICVAIRQCVDGLTSGDPSAGLLIREAVLGTGSPKAEHAKGRVNGNAWSAAHV